MCGRYGRRADKQRIAEWFRTHNTNVSLTGSTEIGLDRIRTRLLDLTNRNKLLNSRHSNASSLRVVDVPLDPVFVRLRAEEKLPFLPVPEPGVHLKDTLTAKDYAEELGWNTSFDLDETKNEDAERLPVLHYQEPLDTVSRKIASAAKTAVEESGANMLYLIFGFLEWYESDYSTQPHLAPLVVLPVTIDRAGGRGRAVETVAESIFPWLHLVRSVNSLLICPNRPRTKLATVAFYCDIRRPGFRSNLEIDHPSFYNSSLNRGSVWRVEFEIRVPVVGPRGQEENLATTDLHQHLLKPVLAVAAVILVGQVVMSAIPEGGELQAGVFAGEIEYDILLGLGREPKHRGLDWVLNPTA